MTPSSQVRQRNSSVFWVVFAVVVFAAWTALLGMSLGYAGPLRDLGPGMELFAPIRWLGELCAAGAEPQRWQALWAMWALMALAMMGPASVPYLVTYSRMGAQVGRAPGKVSLAALAAGYIVVWIAYAAAAAAIQWALVRAAVLDHAGIVASPWAAAALLAMAALWQWTAWKESCLVRCRDPFPFFVSNWREGASGAFRLGILQGIACAGCCWALMLLALVGGVMNVLWMAGATAIMVAEKFPDPGDRLRRTLGAGLAVGALVSGLVGLWHAWGG